jgi:hypothetical protein
MRWGFRFSFSITVAAALGAPSAFAQTSGYDDSPAGRAGTTNPCVIRIMQESGHRHMTSSFKQNLADGTQVINYVLPPVTLYVRPNGAVQRAETQPDGTVVFKRICGDWPPPQIATPPSGPSGPVSGGGSGGGNGGSGPSPSPPSGGEPGPQTPPAPAADNDCPDANSKEIERLEAAIADTQRQITEDQNKLDNAKKLQASAQADIDYLQQKIDELRKLAPHHPSTAEMIQEWQGQIDADNLQLEQAQRDILGAERDLNTDNTRLQNLKEDLAKLRKKACGDQSNSGFLHDILGHVSIGVGIGVGGEGHDDHGDRGGDRGSDRGPTPHD